MTRLLVDVADVVEVAWWTLAGFAACFTVAALIGSMIRVADVPPAPSREYRNVRLLPRDRAAASSSPGGAGVADDHTIAAPVVPPSPRASATRPRP